MIFIRLYDEALAQASYIIGCPGSHTAVVVDPNRLAEQYLAAAAARGLTIVAVTETHIHADFVSGSRELASRAGAALYLSAAGPPEWQYRFRDEANVHLLKDGDAIRVGQVELVAVHTPGHTPEHLSFLVTDHATAAEPMGIITGDFVFVGDVGRPDLLEKTAGTAGSAEQGARQLYRSLAWFRTLPDHLQIWPGHGAGSACGKGLSAMPQSTVGFERRFSWAFGVDDEAAFVRQVLDGQPEPPRYFREMKRVNRAGPALLGEIPVPPRLPDDRLRPLLDAGATVVDTRPAAAFAAGHVPGTISIPFNKSFPTWAGSLLPYDGDLYFLVDSTRPGESERVAQTLAMIGLDTTRGFFDVSAISVSAAASPPLEQVRQVGIAELGAMPDGFAVVDVRGRSEWDAGHIPGAIHIPLGELQERMAEVPRDRPVAIHCQGGGRSAIGASLLQAGGITEIANVTGGFGAWTAAGLPVQKDAET